MRRKPRTPTELLRVRSRRKIEKINWISSPPNNWNTVVFAYKYEDLAKLLAISIKSLRNLLTQKNTEGKRLLDPKSLESICQYFKKNSYDILKNE